MSVLFVLMIAVYFFNDYNFFLGPCCDGSVFNLQAADPYDQEKRAGSRPCGQQALWKEVRGVFPRLHLRMNSSNFKGNELIKICFKIAATTFFCCHVVLFFLLVRMAKEFSEFSRRNFQFFFSHFIL